MAGRVEDSNDKPQITPNSTYLARKRAKAGTQMRQGNFTAGASYTAPTYLENVRINGATVTGNITVNSGITIDGRDISADGAALDALTTDIADHLADTEDAHDASAVSVVPTGNLSANDVQEALEELQTDADTNATNLTNHLSDTTDAHLASAIGVTGAGNLTSTDVESALQELQLDIDSINSPQGEATLADNTASPTSCLSMPVASYDSAQIMYSISRGSGNREVGLINLVNDGSNAGIAQGAIASLGTLGVTFTTDVSGGNQRLLYTTTNTGTAATLKYRIVRWLA
jgi:hypothetical protein